MYTYDQIKLNKKVEIDTLNALLSRLLTNDLELVPENIVKPTIWVKRWLNGEDPYKKGDAVWINTESVEDFISHKQDYIKIYLKQDIRYSHRIRIAEQNNDEQLVWEIMKEAVEKNDIFYLGDITQPVQIKICKQDGATQPPTNSKYWDDFWVTTTESECREYILETLFKVLNKRFNQHVYDYHLSGWNSSDFEAYLDTSLSNVSYANSFHYYSHRAKSLYDGFDFVKKTQVDVFGNGILKWFRQWNSGYLEKGGIIYLDNLRQTQDKINDDVVTVNLNWNGNKYTVPEYNYVKFDSESIYGEASQINVYGNTYGIQEYSLLDMKNLYTVKVTPMSGRQTVYQTYNDNGKFYDICQIMNIKNDSFQFIRDNNIKQYSFYTCGFTTHTN